jgi:periplasmic protein TonB
MSPVARVGGVALSVVAHVGAGALLLTLSVADWSQPLFVDLVERADAPGGAAAGVRGASGTGARSQRSAPTGPPASRAAAADKAAAPMISSGPPPPALMAQVTPPAVSPVPTAEPAPTPPSSPSLPAVADLPSIPIFPAPPSSTDSVAAGTPGTSGALEAGAGSPGGEMRGDGGVPGSALALGTPAPGAGAIPAEYAPYLQRFRQRVQESLVYPLAARRQGLRGSVELDVWLDPAGRVRDVRVARSSSHGLLDDAAIETVRHLEALPFPESLPRRALLIRLPLVFDLR